MHVKFLIKLEDCNHRKPHCGETSRISVGQMTDVQEMVHSSVFACSPVMNKAWILLVDIT